MDWDEIQARREETWNLFRALVVGDEPSRFLKRFASQKKDEIKDDLRSTLELFSSFCRDLVLLRDGGESRLLLNPARQKNRPGLLQNANGRSSHWW